MYWLFTCWVWWVVGGLEEDRGEMRSSESDGGVYSGGAVRIGRLSGPRLPVTSVAAFAVL